MTLLFHAFISTLIPIHLLHLLTPIYLYLSFLSPSPPGNTCAYEIGLASGELSAALGRVDSTQIPPHSPNYPYYDLYKVWYGMVNTIHFHYITYVWYEGDTFQVPSNQLSNTLSL